MYLIQNSFLDDEEQLKLLHRYEEKGVICTITEQMPLCKELFLEELRAGLSVLGVDSFISYKTVNAFDVLVLNRLCDLLSVLYVKDGEAAKATADEMKEALKRIGTDDDSFPEAEIEMIGEAVNEMTSGMTGGMTIDVLKDLKANSFKEKGYDLYFGAYYPIIDEGSFFRLNELHIIRKDKVKSVEKKDKIIRVEYEDGRWCEIGVAE